MIEITSFLLKHLYELMADNYSAGQRDCSASRPSSPSDHWSAGHAASSRASSSSAGNNYGQPDEDDDGDDCDEEDDDGSDNDADERDDNERHNCTGREMRVASATTISQDDERRAGDKSCDHRLEATEQSERSDGCSATNPTSTLTQIQTQSQAKSQNKQSKSTCQDKDHHHRQQQQQPHQKRLPPPQARTGASSALAFVRRLGYHCRRQTSRSSRHTRSLLAREQETNQQIVSFLINNQLPDLVCETAIELIFISVFLAVSWIFVMIIQLHCQSGSAGLASSIGHADTDGLAGQSGPGGVNSYQSARHFYCNTMFLNSLMYCNNNEAKLYSH